MEMSERIRICLRQKSMRLKDLAESAHIPLSTLSDIVHGKTRKLDIQKAKDICRILGCTLDFLVGKEGCERVEITSEIWKAYKEMVLSEIRKQKETGVEAPENLNAITESVRFILEYEAKNPVP